MTTPNLELNLEKITEQGQLDFEKAILQERTLEVLQEEEVQSKKEISLHIAREMAVAESFEHRRELRNELVVMNIPLVTHVIKKYGYFNPDKFQNGCVGLLKAAETFDVSKDIPFHNYAAFCIETEIRAAYKKQNRSFEGKAKGFLDSLDAPMTLGNGDNVDRHDLAEDEISQAMFDELIVEAEVDTLFYQIIIPCIEEYGTRARDLDMELWRDLEIQYFLGLAAAHSQRQRLTFTEMARQLNTAVQNVRSRHKRVMELIRKECENYGFCVGVYGGVYFEEPDRLVKASRRKAKYK